VLSLKILFSEHRAGLIEAKSADDTKLKQLFDRWNSEIASEDYRFDRIETEIEYLRDIEKDEILNAFETGILNNNRSLIMAIEGNEPDQDYSPDYALEPKHLTPGAAFDGFKQIRDIKKIRTENSFFNRAFINKNA